MMLVDVINALTGLVGVTIALLALLWTWSEYWHRPKIYVSYAHWGLSDGNEQRGFVVTVVNLGRTPLLLSGIGLYGAAVMKSPITELREQLRHERTLAWRERRSMNRSNKAPLLADTPAIKIDPFDAYEQKIPLTDKLTETGQISGQYWGISVAARSGTTWRVNGDAIFAGERRLPRWLLDLLPDILRVRWWRYKELVRL